MATTTPDEYLTCAEVGRLLRLSPQAVRRLIYSGDLPAYRAGQVELRIRRADVDAYVTSRPVTSPSPLRDARRRGKKPGPRPAS